MFCLVGCLAYVRSYFYKRKVTNISCNVKTGHETVFYFVYANKNNINVHFLLNHLQLALFPFLSSLLSVFFTVSQYPLKPIDINMIFNKFGWHLFCESSFVFPLWFLFSFARHAYILLLSVCIFGCQQIYGFNNSLFTLNSVQLTGFTSCLIHKFATIGISPDIRPSLTNFFQGTFMAQCKGRMKCLDRKALNAFCFLRDEKHQCSPLKSV